MHDLLRIGENVDLVCVALARYGTCSRDAAKDIANAIEEGRVDYITGALSLGLLLKGAERELTILERLDDYFQRSGMQAESAWIAVVRQALLGSDEAANRIRKHLDHSYD